ncbi:uncharacterized protein LOC142488203 [Ascaphus truei]|uniref:uncharacterized protein LOC142488203 n=1 Tax=Ascaphus truei TaxID=8439 RepID=UPI003F5ACF91
MVHPDQRRSAKAVVASGETAADMSASSREHQATARSQRSGEDYLASSLQAPAEESGEERNSVQAKGQGRTAYKDPDKQQVQVIAGRARTSSSSKNEMWDTIKIGVNACGNRVRDKGNCRKRFDDIRSKLKKKIQDQRVHASGTGGGPPPQRLILTPLEELLRGKLLPVVVEGLAGDRDIGIYPSQFPPVAPGGHVSPETEQVSSPGSCSSTHLEEHDDEDDDDAAIDTEIQSSDHEEVPIETVTQPNRPSTNTYDAIVASEGKIVEAENRRHSDLMTVYERMISLQEETISQLSHLHRVFIEAEEQAPTALAVYSDAAQRHPVSTQSLSADGDQLLT